MGRRCGGYGRSCYWGRGEPVIKRRPYYSILALTVLSLGLAGVVHAVANTFVSLETESGTRTSNATVVGDTTASGSSAVMFATASTGDDACGSFPALPSAKPDATNTGVPAGTTLTNYTGPTTITTNGTVIDGKIITSQGVSAGMDMALWLVGQIHNPGHARTVRKILQYDPAPPYTAEV